ncbi:hypothetical protein Kpol_1057p3 [Vanderwaltozyma polyspora DSM 70294]|uniref:Zn(2)-C6 fungal-type domain-containing protein n=1 Tax=Vanderwaltozyma polyspora (strain ATCC 22028 / DSM 70294 / BCRC 21397 / CBS 2163 / NBRC 10782 / NRRL Y-8283 / UCD 57-17) TaxID=436907 RepID=A7TPH1_VANPO|nr:uncharacterized protein Kpol_1057p3 [Vanderwaltozyma polyspora DSM 70294]EDO15815.1 hypothetical protein Kpol_1057p3 [Vanderwaltozyma polyspora DSM 70294]
MSTTSSHSPSWNATSSGALAGGSPAIKHNEQAANEQQSTSKALKGQYIHGESETVGFDMGNAGLASQNVVDAKEIERFKNMLHKLEKFQNDNSNGETLISDSEEISFDKHSLEKLLDHYQNLVQRVGGERMSAETSEILDQLSNLKDSNRMRKLAIMADPCLNCRDAKKKCTMMPGSQNCVRCETKSLDCRMVDNLNDKKRRESFGTDSYLSKKQRLPENSENIQISHSYPGHLNNVRSEQNYPNTFTRAQENSSTVVDSSQRSSNSNLHRYVQSNPASQIQFPADEFSQQQKKTIRYPRSSFFVGPTSSYDISLMNSIKFDRINQVQLSDSLILRKVSDDVQFLLKEDNNPITQLKQEQYVDLVEKLVYPNGKVLVEIFFKFVHPYFPILHESVFIEKYSRSYSEITAPLLASIYSLALQWWDFHPSLIGFQKPDIQNQLNTIAYKSFYELIERPKLGIVQAGLLILQARSENTSNWTLCSSVVAVAEELGLGVDCQKWQLPQWEKHLRQRISWAVWSFDKWIALVEGRQSHLILGRNWMVRPLRDTDLPASSPIINQSLTLNERSGNTMMNNLNLFDMVPTNEDFVQGTMMFKYRISLSIILSEIMSTFYSEHSKQIVNIEDVLNLAKPLQLKLKEWYRSLPSFLLMTNFKERKFNANASLILAYFATELTLHRKIISVLKTDSPDEISFVCRTAAKARLVAAIEFVHDLKPEHINAFWYASSTGNLMLVATFASILHLSSTTVEEAQLFKDYLRNYIWILRVNSKSFDKEKFALTRLHMLLSQIPDLLTDRIHHSNTPQQRQTNTSHYNASGSNSNPVQNSNLTPSQINELKNIPIDLLQKLINISNSTNTHSASAMLSSDVKTNELSKVSSRTSNISKTVNDNSQTRSAIEIETQRTKVISSDSSDIDTPVTKIPIYHSEKTSRSAVQSLSPARDSGLIQDEVSEKSDKVIAENDEIEKKQSTPHTSIVSSDENEVNNQERNPKAESESPKIIESTDKIEESKEESQESDAASTLEGKEPKDT